MQAHHRAISGRPQQERAHPILHIAQAENDGWLSVNAMDAVAQVLASSISKYTGGQFLQHVQPAPWEDYMLEVCRTSPCGMLRGSDDILAYCEKSWASTRETTKGRPVHAQRRRGALEAVVPAPMLQCGATTTRT